LRKRRIVTFLKFAVPVAIIGWLVASVLIRKPGSPDETTTFDQVARHPWHWGMLGVAFCAAMAGVCLTFARWYLLVRALTLPFRLRDAFRLGFLGFLLNFVGAGGVGGDLFKAVFIAREQKGRRTEAVATVVVDRIVGLYALFLVTTAALFLTDMPDATADVRTIRHLTYLFTALGGIGVLMVLVPGFSNGRISEFLASLPKVGPTLNRLILAVRMYRQRKWILALTGVMSLGVHSLLALAVYSTAIGLFTGTQTLAAPSPAEHFVIVPLASLCGALPISPAGLGTFELAIETLYRVIPAEDVRPGQGLVMALAYRIIQIAIVMIGVVYYWTSRQEVSRVIHEAEMEIE